MRTSVIKMRKKLHSTLSMDTPDVRTSARTDVCCTRVTCVNCDKENSTNHC